MRRVALCFIPSILAGAAFVHPTTRALLGEVVEDVVREARGDKPSLGPPQPEQRDRTPALDDTTVLDDPDLAPDAPVAPAVVSPNRRAAEAAAPGAEPEAAAEPAPPASPPKPTGPRIASRAKEAWIYAGPTRSSRKLGYLRAGAIIERDEKPISRKGCEGGWFKVAPHGFLCAGENATLDLHDPVVEASRRRPRLGDGLPYVYALSRYPVPPLYARLPTLEERREHEADLGDLAKTHAKLTRDPSYLAPDVSSPLPDTLLYGRPAPALAGEYRGPDALVLGVARPKSGFALLSTFEHDGRPFGLTTDLAVLPLDRTRIVRESAFQGRLIGETEALPAAFAKGKKASLFKRRGNAVVVDAPLGDREAVLVTGETVSLGGATYYPTRDGRLVRESQVVRIDPLAEAPGWAGGGRKWIDVSILRQSLVAYEGTRPVFATLVSTGADGLGDPETTHSTVQGTFLIHTKHVSFTMDGDEEDVFDYRDVPFVQFFHEGYALHAAYWHDQFGTPRSHGCVNLAPRDAAWLFGWTTPDVPEGWHASLSLKKGTLVHVHP